MQFFLQNLFVWKLRFVFRNHCRRKASTQSIFYYFTVFVFTKQYADAWIFVLTFNIPVQRFQIKVKLTQMFGFEFICFQFESDKALQPLWKNKRSI
jgi:hypothetical protein